MRPRLVIVLIAVLALGSAGLVAANRAGDQADRQDAVGAWQAEINAWQGDRMDVVDFAPGEASMEAAVSGTALRPAWPGESVAHDSVDAVNAACTAANSYAEAVELAPEPPAPPAEAELSQEQRQQFTEAAATLAQLRADVTPAAAALRQFCGTYPTLLLAHEKSPAPANEAIAEALRISCVTEELTPACTATITAATALTDGEDPATVRQNWAIAVAEMPGLDQVQADDQEAVHQALAALITAQAVDAQADLTAAAAAFKTALQQE